MLKPRAREETVAITQEQNQRLVRVEGDAPMGRLLRENYWIPACLSAQLEADGPPRRVRLLGKDYAAFRATDGRIGFFDERCPHRGASLVLARNEDCALRCVFHAWKFDVSGKVVEVPTQPVRAEEFAAKVRLNHYSTHEGGGIVWVWLGAQPAPVFPELPFTAVPESRVWMTVTKAWCNWVQGVEGTLDSAHVGTLHESYMQRLKTSRAQAENTGAGVQSLDNLAPQYEVERTRYGLDAIALRPMPDGATYVRTTRYIMPFVSLTPFGHPDVPAVVFITSPVDDHHHNLFWGAWSLSRDLDPAEIPDFLGWAQGVLPYDPENFGRFTGDRDSNWGQDREAMARGHFTGMTGNLLQEDLVVQASMGPIVDRTLDHLSAGDVAVVQGRLLLLDALADMEAGRNPRGATAGMDLRDVLPENTLLPVDRSRAEAEPA
jgi:phthalate 4,5-dioxygenase oxygenase subunit